MSLPHALLTSLIERPSSGSELARRFDSSIGFFWPATHQQIYRELARMEEAGWVASGAGGRGRRKEYRCLPAGRAELRRWMAQEAHAPVIRDPLLVRLRARAALGGGAVTGHVRARLAHHEARLAAYEAIAARDFGGELDRRARVQQAILAAGIGYEAQGVQWCQDTLAALDA